MLFNEKYAISHIDYNTGRITIEYSFGEGLSTGEDNFRGLIDGFSKLCGGVRESPGYASYTIDKLPYDFCFGITNDEEIIITVEDMRKIDEIVRYIKDSLADINYNMLYT